ncbi:TraB/GumN family protein [Ferrimonas pelagia]|uniref:TraB/GumN family protein n=1 Tax=Ferrimonas pelagia TaxID=1177826 RepID=A0ABP9E8W6_9GAMM
MKKWIGLVVWFCCALSVAQAKPGDQPVFFKLEAQGHTAWLLGSIHVGEASFYPLPEQIEAAFTQATSLALEADPNDPNSQALVMAHALAKGALPKALAKDLEAYCGQLGIPCDQRLAPWLLSAQIAMSQMSAAGYYPVHGIEAHLLQRWRGNVLELEGMERQLTIFASLSDTAQHEMLAAALVGQDDEFEQLIRAWRQGDKEALAEQMKEGMAGSPELWQKLMVDRNQDMAAILGQWLGQYDQMFVVIGAGHLVGQGSIPQLLQQQGIAITDCWQQRCQ